MANIIDRLFSFLGYEKPQPKKTVKKAVQQIRGRSSVEDTPRHSGVFASIQDRVVSVDELRLLNYMSIYNEDISHAVFNLVSIANSDFSISFPNLPAEKQKAAYERIGKSSVYNEGLNGFIRDALRQIVVSGALSAEIVPNVSLTAVEKLVFVPTWQIEFVFDDLTDNYIPCQRPRRMIREAGGIRLNTYTYKYYALERIENNPYAVPPLISALRATETGKLLLDDINYLAEKMGVLGILSMMLEEDAPDIQGGELPYSAEHKARLREQLREAENEISKGLKGGAIVGFKNSHELKVTPTVTNASGASEIYKVNDTIKLSGLKQDPNLLGRDYNTSEAFARVTFEMLLRQSKGLQFIVASFIQEYIKIDLLLGGFGDVGVSVKFDNDFDKMKNIEAKSKEIDNILKLLNAGLITKDEAAIKTSKL